MTNRILFITDIHIKIKNLDDVDILEKAIEKTSDVSLIIIGGDILDKHRIQTSCYKKALSLINTCSKIAITYVIVGNHDYIDNNQFLTEFHWMNNLKKWPNVVIVDKVVSIFCGFYITCVPFVPPGRFIEALNTSTVPWKRSKLIFAHQEIKNCKIKNNTLSLVGDLWPSTYPTIISGHIHDVQQPQKNVIYPGSTLNHGLQTGLQKLCFVNTGYDKHASFSFCITCLPLNIEKTTIIYTNINDIFTTLKNTTTTKKTIFCVKDDFYQIKKFKHTQFYKDLSKQTYNIFFVNK